MSKKHKKILIVEHLTERISFFIEKFGDHYLDITENYRDAIFYLLTNNYDYIFLGGEFRSGDGSGCDVAEFLKAHPKNLNNHASIFVHSWNVVEVESICKLLPYATYKPFNEAVYGTLSL